MIIYLDMDGVVADWQWEADRIVGYGIKDPGFKYPSEDWEKIKQHDRFYSALPLCQGAEDLVSWVRKYQKLNPETCTGIRFLTALPHNNDMPWAIWDKVNWAKHYFIGIPVFFGPYSKDKHNHCQPGDILLDDRKDNCDDWRKAGGLAHQYAHWPEAEAWLRANLRGQLP